MVRFRPLESVDWEPCPHPQSVALPPLPHSVIGQEVNNLPYNAFAQATVLLLSQAVSILKLSGKK